MHKDLTKSIKVLIVDDHPRFSDALNALLTPEVGIQVLGQVFDSREAKEKVSSCNPHVVLMDYHMPYLNGIELTRLLLRQKPDLKILIISMYTEERLIESFRQCGARGYVFKTATSGELLTATRAVHEGATYFPQTGTHALIPGETIGKPNLSEREMEVAQLMKSGMKTKAIARALRVSPYSVEMYLTNIRLKSGSKNTADFIRFIRDL